MGRRPEDPSALLARVERIAARAARPGLVVRAVAAALSMGAPGMRAEALVRRAGQSWVRRLALGDWPEEPLTSGPDAARGARLEVPVRRPGLRALLAVEAPPGGEAAPATRELLEGLEAFLAPALLQEERTRRLEAAVERARFLQRLGTQLNRSLAADDILRCIAVRLHGVVPFGRATLVTVSPDGRDRRALWVEGSDGFRRVHHEQIPVSDRVVDEVLSRRQPLRQDDLKTERAEAGRERLLLDAGYRSRIVLPLVARRRVVGALGLAAHRPGALTGANLSLVRHVARPLALSLDNARLYREADERSRQMMALHEVGLLLASLEDVRDVTQRVLEILHDAFRFQHSAVLTLERDAAGAEWLVMQASRGYSLREDRPFRLRVDERGITSRAVRTGEMVYVPDVLRDADYVRGVARGRSEVSVPLVVGGKVVGVLDIESTRVAAFTAAQLETLKLFSLQVALTLERARIFEDIRRQAMVDDLSGLLNQRYFHEKLRRELDRSQRTGRPFALAMIDLDDFKRINDQHGHVQGNRAIARLGEILSHRVRSIDAAARFGGDEFALILSETTAEHGVGVLAEVRELLADEGVPGIGPLHISAGVVEWRPGMRSVREVVAAADAALYRAKRQGKNQTRVAQEADEAAAGSGAEAPEAGPP